MTVLQAIDPAAPETVPPSAVVWINGRRAIVATMSGEREIATSEVTRGKQTELAYVALVVQAIGDRQRVMILGPSSVRLALEREYVAIFRRPDRLVDVEPADAVDPAELVDRLRILAA